ncbi:alveolar macrophage chemotactic factor-like [Hoplias malabaricus]|uniref:alveolar macrophage chemotactic factor-like n=1 Tax=Hoplias malabaricus TaxID=27720 RepID=UPI0034631053
MNRPILLLILASLACATVSSAFRLDGRQRCLCTKDYTVQPQNIVQWKVYPRSPLCSKVEIVVTLRNKKKVCLKPTTTSWQLIMQKERVFA